ncbi:MAG: pyridoxal-phosphate dependent enzyme, partial [Asgard group archaeon]|nr:pyridoxal-phosphate dependent enzyme [Asgard group archaeon]
MQKEIVCTNCHAQLGEIQRSITCPQCSTNAVEFQVFFTADDKPAIHQANQGVWRYSDFLPDFTQKISLGEGLTPIRKAHQLFAEDIQLSFKLEGKNPTGSFLDRVSPVLVSDAIAKGMVSTICASDGNLGASISAYCANAGLDSICVVPKSTSPEKKVQMIAHGAKIIDYGDTIDDSLDLA